MFIQLRQFFIFIHTKLCTKKNILHFPKQHTTEARNATDAIFTMLKRVNRKSVTIDHKSNFTNKFNKLLF